MITRAALKAVAWLAVLAAMVGWSTTAGAQGTDKIKLALHWNAPTHQFVHYYAAIKLGFYISFSGIVTFKNARALQDVARSVPLERLLIETDSPYLAPVPYRGKTNEPGFVPKVAEKVAELKNVSVEEVAAASTSNFFNLFRPMGNKLDAAGKESQFWQVAANQALTSDS